MLICPGLSLCGGKNISDIIISDLLPLKFSTVSAPSLSTKCNLPSSDTYTLILLHSSFRNMKFELYTIMEIKIKGGIYLCFILWEMNQM